MIDSATCICEKCHDLVGYNIVEQKKVTYIKNRKVTYSSAVAICENCKRVLYVSELNDLNKNRLITSFKAVS